MSSNKPYDAGQDMYLTGPTEKVKVMVYAEDSIVFGVFQITHQTKFNEFRHETPLPETLAVYERMGYTLLSHGDMARQVTALRKELALAERDNKQLALELDVFKQNNEAAHERLRYAREKVSGYRAPKTSEIDDTSPVCNVCGNRYPLSKEYWYYRKDGRRLLKCKECSREDARLHHHKIVKKDPVRLNKKRASNVATRLKSKGSQ